MSSMVDAVLTRFREHLVHDLTARWDIVQSSASEELLMLAYLDPRTKHFEFVKAKKGVDVITLKIIKHNEGIIMSPSGIYKL